MASWGLLGVQPEKFFLQKFSKYQYEIFWDESFSLKSICKKIEEKVDPFGAFATVQTSGA